VILGPRHKRVYARLRRAMRGDERKIVWDIVLGLGTTDPIGGDVAEWAGWIVTAYVGGRSLEKIARTIWRRP